MNLDAFDQPADDLALRYEIDRPQSPINGGGKVIETIDHEEEFSLTSVVASGLLDLVINLFQPVFQLSHLRVEVCLLNRTLGIAVNESRPTLLQLKSLLFESCDISTGRFLLFENAKSALVFILQAVRMRQELDDLLPHEVIEPLSLHLLIVAEAFATETVGIGSNATIISVVPFVTIAGFADCFAVISVTTMTADNQSLKQVSSTAPALTG